MVVSLAKGSTVFNNDVIKEICAFLDNDTNVVRFSMVDSATYQHLQPHVQYRRLLKLLKQQMHEFLETLDPFVNYDPSQAKGYIGAMQYAVDQVKTPAMERRQIDIGKDNRVDWMLALSLRSNTCVSQQWKRHITIAKDGFEEGHAFSIHTIFCSRVGFKTSSDDGTKFVEQYDTLAEILKRMEATELQLKEHQGLMEDLRLRMAFDSGDWMKHSILKDFKEIEIRYSHLFKHTHSDYVPNEFDLFIDFLTCINVVKVIFGSVNPLDHQTVRLEHISFETLDALMAMRIQEATMIANLYQHIAHLQLPGVMTQQDVATLVSDEIAVIPADESTFGPENIDSITKLFEVFRPRDPFLTSVEVIVELMGKCRVYVALAHKKQ